MQYKTKTLDTSSQGYATNVWTIDYDVLGWRPDGTKGSHQVTANTIGTGGTFMVQVRVPGDAAWKNVAANKTASDIVMVDLAIVEAIKVTVTPGTGTYTPLITITSRPRGFAA